MTDATERVAMGLAAGTMRYGQQAGERGRYAGAAWAAEIAEYLQLKRLAAVAAYLKFDDEQAGYKVVNTILGERIWTAREIAEFREILGLDDGEFDADSRDYWQGFVEGALEVFETVAI